MFFNTGIGTYVWILSNKKIQERKGKVQLINLSDTYTGMRKSEGTKRKYLSEDQIDDVVREYDAFVETKRSKIFKTTDFAYRKVHVKRPLRAKITATNERIESLDNVSVFQKLDKEQQNAWLGFFQENIGDHAYDWVQKAVASKNKVDGFGKTSKALGTAFNNRPLLKLTPLNCP